MILFCYLLCLSLLPMGTMSEILLSQSNPEIRKPGESVKITCKTSGFNLADVYMHWVRQAPGGGLEWVGRIDPADGGTIYLSSLQERFKITTENSIGTVYLEISHLTLEDTATYYCARDTVEKGRDLPKISSCNDSLITQW
uniref:Ig-like domain-containing protein n=1 Tax=Xenopus tropicalis TaxID=8364 RepID=A0A803JUD5_XENTR